MLSKKMHFLSMKGTFYLQNIINGTKQYEGRINSDKCKKMKVNDLLKLFDKDANWGVICEITSIDVFDNFGKMLKTMGVLKFLPHLENKNLLPDELLQEGIKTYLDFPLSERMDSLGTVAIGVKFFKKEPS